MAILNFAPETMTGASAPSPFVASASSEFSATFAAYKAFDGGFGTAQYWLGTGLGVDWLKLDTGSGNSHLVVSYSIQVNSIPEATRAPKDWTFEGSNDDSSWTTLDTRTSQTSWGSGEIRNYAVTGVSTSYRYFRLNITANNGDVTFTQVASLFILESNGSLNFAPVNMSTSSRPYPFTASASSEVSSSFAAWKAFEGNLGVAAYWLGSNSGVDWLKLDVGLGTYLLDNYTVQVNSLGEPTRAPKDWTMEGSNDNSSWTTVDTRTNQTSWGTSEARNFRCATRTTAYRYFRFNVTANNGDADTQVAEMKLFVVSPSSSSASVNYYRLAGIGN